MNDRLNAFKSRFSFKPELDGYVGIEREWFIRDENTGHVVPRSEDVIQALGGVSDKFTYELSACQGESRHGPCLISDLGAILTETDEILQRTLKPLGLRACYKAVGPEDMPLAVYPDERYLQHVKTMPEERLRAACRTAGMHVHVGKRDHASALGDYESARSKCDQLIRMGDASNGERFRLYEVVQPRWQPRTYPSWQAFHEDAQVSGFEENPRDNWQIIRITAKGTLEFRMFDSTDDIDMIVKCAEKCLGA